MVKELVACCLLDFYFSACFWSESCPGATFLFFVGSNQAMRFAALRPPDGICVAMGVVPFSSS